MRIVTCFCLLFLVRVASAQNIDVLHYEFEIALHDTNDTIEGKTSIQVVLKQPGDAVFDLTGIERGKGMKVTAATIFYKKLSTAQFIQNAQQVIIPTQNGKPGDTAWITIYYKGLPDDGLIISKNKYGDRTFFADNWPNRAHHWIPCVDRPDDKATFEFMVTAPAQYSVISNGVKVEEKKLSNVTKLTHWKEDVPLPTKVMVIGVAKFATKTFDDYPAGIPISAWVYPQDSTKGFYDYALAPEIVKFFSVYIAPYPYNKLANVQSKTIFGGMENASCIFYAEESVTGTRSSEDLLAHEIAHQWFGDMATEKSFAHLWLSEGFATYFTDLYFEKKYGRDAAIKRLKKDRDDAISFAKISTHAVVDSTKDLMSLLNANSYQKGGWILHMLRNEVGDTLFQKIIQSYYNQYQGSNADTRDFEAVAERVYGKDLKWFFDQWLYKPGVPQLDFSLRVDKGKSYLTITQKQASLYRFNLTLGLVNKATGAVVKQQVAVKDKRLEIPMAASVSTILTDPDTNLLFDGKSIINR